MSEAKESASTVGTPFRERDLHDKVILITGASRGLGAALAAGVAQRGARVILVGREKAALDKTVAEIGAHGGKAEGRVCDIATLSQVRDLFQEVETKYGYIDVLVNNAGIMPGLGQPVFGEMGVSDDDELKCFRTNVEGTHFVTKYALPLLLKSPQGFERTVLFVSSSSGWLSEPEDANGMLAYHASKAAMNGLMVNLNQMYGSDSAQAKMLRGEDRLGRVVSVHPGIVQTGLGIESALMFEPDLSSEEFALRKKDDGFTIPVETGVDSLLWLVCAADGLVHTGKTYFERRIHPF
jgi:NAD(P)-dependent dehydrogenase (short-subunit alcohol dehydrogenase family)